MSQRLGPRVRLDLTCSGCEKLREEKYSVQGDSGWDCTCLALDPPKPLDSRVTPDWCPIRETAIDAHTRGLRAEEREACAVVADRWAAANIDAFREQALAVECVARRIRERGKPSGTTEA